MSNVLRSVHYILNPFNRDLKKIQDSNILLPKDRLIKITMLAFSQSQPKLVLREPQPSKAIRDKGLSK